MTVSSTSSDLVAELRAAIRFLTVVPVSASTGGGFGAVTFPAVGWGLGLGAWVVDRLLGGLGSPLVDVAIVVFVILATGAIHLDGLADSCDGLGGRSPEDRLRLMAEGAVGTYAVLGLLIAVTVRLAALVSLPPEGRAAALLLTPAIGRVAMLLAAADMPAARPDGLGAAFVASLERRAVLRATVVVVAVTILFGGAAGALALAAGAGGVFLVRMLAARRLGGVTGDVIGASGEIAEGLALVAFVAGTAT